MENLTGDLISRTLQSVTWGPVLQDIPGAWKISDMLMMLISELALWAVSVNGPFAWASVAAWNDSRLDVRRALSTW
jgi:hypothetical protein